MTKQCGFIALIGAPNAGKSTLLNQLMGTKLAIVTPKVQTTRDVIRGIAIEDDCQLVYMDTPGIFQTEQNFEKAMVSAAWKTTRDSDATVLLIDALAISLKGKISDANITLLNTLKDTSRPSAVWLNKTDKVSKDKLLQVVAEISKHVIDTEIFMGSALKGHGVGDLKKWMISHMPQSEWMFPEDQMSDLPMRFIAAEITREKLFLRLRQELPYGLRVEPEDWEEKADGSVKISQIIMVNRDAHKKIILGKQGVQLKEIGQSARISLQKHLECKVHLFLFVKVVPDWKDRKEFMPLTV